MSCMWTKQFKILKLPSRKDSLNESSNASVKSRSSLVLFLLEANVPYGDTCDFRPDFISISQINWTCHLLDSVARVFSRGVIQCSADVSFHINFSSVASVVHPSLATDEFQNTEQHKDFVGKGRGVQITWLCETSIKSNCSYSEDSNFQ